MAYLGFLRCSRGRLHLRLAVQPAGFAFFAREGSDVERLTANGANRVAKRLAALFAGAALVGRGRNRVAVDAEEVTSGSFAGVAS